MSSEISSGSDQEKARVRIAYDVQAGDSIESRELPFVIGVLGDFSANAGRGPWSEREILPVDSGSFNDVLDAVRPRVRFKMMSSLAGGLEIDLTFRHMDDFGPERFVEQIIGRLEPLRRLYHSRSSNDGQILRIHVDAILHAPEFQALESAWRGLWWLVSRSEASPRVKIKLIDVSKQELLRDTQDADF